MWVQEHYIVIMGVRVGMRLPKVPVESFHTCKVHKFDVQKHPPVNMGLHSTARTVWCVSTLCRRAVSAFLGQWHQAGACKDATRLTQP